MGEPRGPALGVDAVVTVEGDGLEEEKLHAHGQCRLDGPVQPVIGNKIPVTVSDRFVIPCQRTNQLVIAAPNSKAGMMLQTGSVDWAESNQLVLLFPQAGQRALNWSPNAWDYWGSVTGAEADGKRGLQLQAVAAMLSDASALVRDAVPVS